ncbi:hypothetical protein ACHAXR_001282, partial [Thalassiosira sp. AJA248-18]
MLTSSMMPLVLLPVAVTNAFLHSTINIHPRAINRIHLPQNVIFAIRAHTNKHEINSQIDKVLKETQLELLSDISKLQKQHPQSTVEADNVGEFRDNLTPEQMVREALLSSRLPMPFLNRTKIGPSTIDGAGRGLFATENISEGDVITCYPGDALLCELPSLDDGIDDESEDFDEESEDFDEEEEDCIDEIVLWGTHVPEKHRWDEDAVFDGTESTPSLTSYALSADHQYSVMGHPALDDNPAYYGHFANDGAGQMALQKNSASNIQASLELGLDTEGEMGVEENISAYVLQSLEVANAIHKHRPFDGEELHMVTVATRDIEIGEEILVTYGP